MTITCFQKQRRQKPCIVACGICALGVFRHRHQWWAGAVWQPSRAATSKVPLNNHHAFAWDSEVWQNWNYSSQKRCTSLWTTHAVWHLIYGPCLCCVTSYWMYSAWSCFWVKVLTQSSSPWCVSKWTVMCGWVMLQSIYQQGFRLHIWGEWEENNKHSNSRSSPHGLRAAVCHQLPLNGLLFLEKAKQRIKDEGRHLHELFVSAVFVFSMDVYCCFAFVTQQKCRVSSHVCVVK